MKNVPRQRTGETNSFQAAHCWTSPGDSPHSGARTQHVWASAQGGTCNPANLQGSPGHNAWLPQPVGCCGNGNPEAPSWVAGVWTVAGLPVTSEPFCRCQCYAGELKGKPQLLLLGNRAFAPNLVPERGSSRVSVLHDSTVVRRTGIRLSLIHI